MTLKNCDALKFIWYRISGGKLFEIVAEKSLVISPFGFLTNAFVARMFF